MNCYLSLINDIGEMIGRGALEIKRDLKELSNLKHRLRQVEIMGEFKRGRSLKCYFTFCFLVMIILFDS
jgi:hypothetical protein